MKILVVGSGGREHAIIKKLSENNAIDKIYCAPGNGGISDIAECVNIDAMDMAGMVDFSKTNSVDLVVVAPDDPLAVGMVDVLEANGIRAFGPDKSAARMESSKVFSKNLMKKYNIPTAAYEVFDDINKALEYFETAKFPVFIKADGLAKGKGAVYAGDFNEAINISEEIMQDKIFGTAGNKIVVEELLSGPEVSVLAFTDGKTVCPMVSAQDHKRIFDNDEGPNTGGMGTFSPSRIYDEKLARICMDSIFIPTISAMNSEGIKFKGVLYFGLMITEEGPKVIEYNCRFGDPETQVVLPRLKTDLLEIFNAVIDERLDQIEIKWEENAAVCVVMASGGYPGDFTKGYEISGMDDVLSMKDVFIYHAGSRKNADGKYLTAGGRVLGVTALGNDLEDAILNSYKAVEKITFKDAHYRKDIGVK